MERIKNIEFLRIVGCLAIVFLHIFAHRLSGIYPEIILYSKLSKMTLDGSFAIELFFILSGVFFILTYNKDLSLFNFIKKKIIRFFPVMFFCVAVSFILSLFKIIKFKFFGNLLSLLFLDGTGLSHHGNIQSFWYIGTLFWVLVFYHYLLKNYERKNVDLLISMLVYFSYNFLVHTNFSNSGTTYYYFITTGILRGLGGIGLGYLIGAFYKNNYEKIKSLDLKMVQKLFLTVIEFLCLFFIINNLMFHHLKYNNSIIFVVVFSTITVLFLLNQGFISQFLNKNIFVNLAKYTYSIFLSHMIIINSFYNTLWKDYGFVCFHPVINILITLVCVILLGIITYHMIEKPSVDFFKKILN